MAGNYLLDTNIFIYAINQGLRLPEQTYTASVITAMELLSWPGLGDLEEEKLKKILSRVAIIQLEASIQAIAIEIRRKISRNCQIVSFRDSHSDGLYLGLQRREVDWSPYIRCFPSTSL